MTESKWFWLGAAAIMMALASYALVTHHPIFVVIDSIIAAADLCMAFNRW